MAMAPGDLTRLPCANAGASYKVNTPQKGWKVKIAKRMARKNYWMASEPASDRSLEPEASFGIFSFSHFSSSSLELRARSRKRNPTRPLRSAHATSDSISIERVVPGNVNCKRGLAFLG